VRSSGRRGADEVAELRRALAHVRPWVRPAVGARVEPPRLQDVVLDELHVRVERERLVVDAVRTA
jgi:hypothetical protein